jgi:hypothetical protein
MKHISIKTLLLALLFVVAVPCVNAQVAHIGDILCTTGVYVSPVEFDDSGLEAMGVIFYVDATGQHGWAVALEDAGNFKWSNDSYVTPLPNYSTVRAVIYDHNGLFNTQEMLNWDTPYNYTFPAFEALDVDNGWYLPAIGQLNYLYGNLVEVNEGLAAAGGTMFVMTSRWTYWSSSEKDSMYAWCLSNTGKLMQYPKNSSDTHVRGVHNF